MMALFDVTADADAAADGSSGVQIHVDITQLPTVPPIGGLATTGMDVPVLLIIAAVILIAAGAVIVIRRARRRP